jgi:enediyne biosynthesis protein E4
MRMIRECVYCVPIQPHTAMRWSLLILFTLIAGGAGQPGGGRAGTESKLFTLLSPDQTGVGFVNELVDTPEHNIMIYSNYYGGAGVAVGDINNDGLPDLYFAGNLVSDRLYLNKGNLVFEDITESAGIIDNGAWASGVIMGDVNQDGYLDIYVTCELYDNLPELRRNKFYLNNGDNTFTECAARYGIDDPQRTRHATFLDYDKDGDLDLFLLNMGPNPGDYSEYYYADLLLPEYRPRLLELQGDVYVDVTDKAGVGRPGFPNSVSASDINGDGWTDLFVANDFWVRDFIYINNGDGTFTDQALERTRHHTFSSMGIDMADINNDGLLDAIVLDMLVEDHTRRNNMMGGMKPKRFNELSREQGTHQYLFNMLHLNTGGGYFSEIGHLAGFPATDWSWTCLFADLDNDGWKDLYIANGLMRDIRHLDAAVTFRNYVESALADFIAKNPDPGDKTLWDIVDINKTLNLAPSVKTQNYAFRNNGDLTFTNLAEEWGLPELSFSNGAAYADLDNDGDLDLVVNNINDPAFIYRNNSETLLNHNYMRVVPVSDEKSVSILGVKVWAETESGTQFFEITDVRGMYSTSEHIAHFGLGSDDRVTKLKVRWPDGKENEFHNLVANQILEVRYSKAEMPKAEAIAARPTLFTETTSGLGAPIRHVENEFNDYVAQLTLPHKMSAFGPCLAVADINGDGLEDFFLGGSASNPGRVYLQEPGGSFGEMAQPALMADKIHEDVGAVWFDADGDGDPDLYAVSGGNEFLAGSKSYHDRLYLNDGTGLLSRSEDALPGLPISGSRVRPFDFDGDGDLDLLVCGRHTVWAYPEPVSTLLLRNEGGKFEDVTAALAPGLQNIGMVTDARWVDFNGDGRTDIVLAGEWMPLTLFRNTGDGFVNVTQDWGLEKTTGWWWSVQAGDLDGDGDLDLVAGNMGLNYKYVPTEKEPLEVYYYDFDNNGKKDLVLTYYHDGRPFPIRDRATAVEQVPALKEKFKTNDHYARSDVQTVYGEKNLEKALHYAVTTFATAWFENDGNGRFIPRPLPVEAQFSSVNDILIGDFDGDGNPDILLAGNLYPVEVETIRADAGYGLLLRGDGKGHFAAIPWAESGFFVPWDVKCLAPIAAGGHATLLVGCNNDTLRSFRINREVY